MADRINDGKMDMFDEARAIRSTMELCHLTQSELARQLGVSQSYVANKLRLLKFSEKMAEKIRAAGLSERHARALLRLIESEPDGSIKADENTKNSIAEAKTNAHSIAEARDERAERVLAEICDRSLTVRESEALIDTELVRALPHRLSRGSSPLDSIDALHTAIRSACTTLRSQGIDARTRTTYLGTDLYITVVIKGV